MKSANYSVLRVASDKRAYSAVVEATRRSPNGELADVHQTIAAFEQKYKMTSDEAQTAIVGGSLAPTRDIEGWMMAIRVRDYLVEARARQVS